MHCHYNTKLYYFNRMLNWQIHCYIILGPINITQLCCYIVADTLLLVMVNIVKSWRRTPPSGEHLVNLVIIAMSILNYFLNLPLAFILSYNLQVLYFFREQTTVGRPKSLRFETFEVCDSTINTFCVATRDADAESAVMQHPNLYNRWIGRQCVWCYFFFHMHLKVISINTIYSSFFLH